MARDLEITLTAADHQSTPGRPLRSTQKRRSFPTLRAVTALMLREMSSRYGRTPGGYIWAILEPVGALVVLTVAFSLLLRSPSLGNSFALFYASGYLPFIIYAGIAANVQNAISFSKPLLQYPAVSWIDSIIARFTLNLLTSLVVFIIVITGVLQVTEATATLSLGPIAVALMLMALVGLGIGTLNCFLVGLFPAWGNIWGIISRPMFLFAGVIFLYEDLPPIAQDILWYTPWIHLTGLARSGIYPTYSPDYISLTLVLLWVLVPLFFGLLMLRRFHKDILNR